MYEPLFKELENVLRPYDEFIMLFRSHLRNGISLIGLARSKNGIDWVVDKKPAMIP